MLRAYNKAHKLHTVSGLVREDTHGLCQATVSYAGNKSMTYLLVLNELFYFNTLMRFTEN